MSLIIGSVVERIRNSVEASANNVYQHFQGFFLVVASFLITGTLVIWLSIFMYAAFYYTYMPTFSQHEKPVNLQFKPCPDDHGACSYLSANFTFRRKANDKMFVRGLPYNIKFDMEMPESPRNIEAGMFMVKIHLLTEDGDLVLASGRSALLRYRSKFVRSINALFSMWSLLLGRYEEKQMVTVDLVQDFHEHAVKRVVSASIEVQSKFVQIYSARLRVIANFQGLRYLLFHYPVPSAIVGIVSIMYFLVIIATLSWWKYLGGPSTDYVVDSVFTIPETFRSVFLPFVPSFLLRNPVHVQTHPQSHSQTELQQNGDTYRMND